MAKVLGEITVQFGDDEGERKFKVRRRNFLDHSRAIDMLKASGTLVPDGKGGMNIAAGTINAEKYAAFQVELCRISLCDTEGKLAFKTDDIADWGGQNVGAVVAALDVFFGPAKTTVDHAGN